MLQRSIAESQSIMSGRYLGSRRLVVAKRFPSTCRLSPLLTRHSGHGMSRVMSVAGCWRRREAPVEAPEILLWG
eukprot:COSAG01_NODE_37015_length_509_cov_2.121951_1_plen_73_part_01